MATTKLTGNNIHKSNIVIVPFQYSYPWRKMYSLLDVSLYMYPCICILVYVFTEIFCIIYLATLSYQGLIHICISKYNKDKYITDYYLFKLEYFHLHKRFIFWVNFDTFFAFLILSLLYHSLHFILSTSIFHTFRLILISDCHVNALHYCWVLQLLCFIC